ncbi:MAG: outer membrane protein transport protein [Methylocystis sp.]|uniref:OmpP1/FadL family transporter n=1 Tax=Methylocystis sp. TaxID=1911079 RepID=UPI003938E51C
MHITSLSRLVTFVALAAAIPTGTFAADGFFVTGYGPRQKALAGASVADGRDGMAAAVNPATIVGLDRQYAIGVTANLFYRGYSTTGLPRVVAPGEVRSGRSWTPIPNTGSIRPIDADSAWSFVSYSNGGINSAYDVRNFRAPLGGPYGGGFAGVDIRQAFFSIDYARRFHTAIGPITIGLAPTIAAQMVNIQGLQALAPYSTNPWEMSDMGFDWSFGGGVRLGVLWGITDKLRFGFSGSTPMLMSPLAKYSGLFAEQGRFDIPAQLQAGFAYDLTPDLTLMADWRHIFYSAVPAIGNGGGPLRLRSLGAGTGLDYQDTDSASFGVEWRATPGLALRAGYHYSTVPLRSRSLNFAALAPSLAKHHLGAGFNYAVTRNSSFDFAFLWAFKNSVSGYEAIPQTATLPFGRINTAANINVWAYGGAFTVGYNYKFDADDESWLPTHF